MLSGNYILLFKNLGKFCYVFENAGTTQATQQVAFDAMVEQAAKPSGAWEVISDLAPYITQLNTALQNGAVAIQSVIVKAAIAYLLTDTVAAYFARKYSCAYAYGSLC
jgi:hypothetical protein